MGLGGRVSGSQWGEQDERSPAEARVGRDAWALGPGWLTGWEVVQGRVGSHHISPRGCQLPSKDEINLSMNICCIPLSLLRLRSLRTDTILPSSSSQHPTQCLARSRCSINICSMDKLMNGSKEAGKEFLKYKLQGHETLKTQALELA